LPPLLDAGKQPVKRTKCERVAAEFEQGLKGCQGAHEYTLPADDPT
jgi:hypothetical protein